MGPVAAGAAEEAGLVEGGDRLLSCAGGPTQPNRGPSLVSRVRPDSKHHVLTDGQGIPLAVSLTGGNRNDVTRLGRRGVHPAGVGAGPTPATAGTLSGSGYDHDKYRRLLRQRGIRPVIAERGQEHASRLGTFRRLRIRWERRNDIHEAFPDLAHLSSLTATSNALVRTSYYSAARGWAGHRDSGDAVARHLSEVLSPPERGACP